MGEALFSPEAGLFVAGVIVNSILGYIICSEHVAVSKEIRVKITCWHGLILIISWIGVSLRKYYGRPALPLYLVVFSIALAPIGAMFFEPTSKLKTIAFWVALFSWTVAAIVSVLTETETRSRWDKLTIILGTIWTTLNVIISLGLNPWLPYAPESIRQLKSLHALLDIRHISAICFGVAITGISLARALADDLPPPGNLPRYRAPSPESPSLLAAIMTPFIAVFNVFLYMAHTMLNAAWKLLYITAMLFFSLGREVGAVLRDIFSEKEALWLLAKLLSLFILCVFLALLVRSAAEPALSYLAENSWTGQAVPFSVLMILGALMTVAIIGILSLVQAIDLPPLLSSEVEEALQASAFGIATILSSLLVSAGVLFAISRIWLHDIQGFRQPGILAAILVILVAGGILKILLTSGLQRES